MYIKFHLFFFNVAYGFTSYPVTFSVEKWAGIAFIHFSFCKPSYYDSGKHIEVYASTDDLTHFDSIIKKILSQI